VKLQNFDELSKIDSIKDSVNNNSNTETSTITSGEIQTDAKISASKTESPESVTKEMKNNVLNLWNPYWSGSFEVMIKSYQYVYESVDSSNLKSYTTPSSYRLFGITLKDLGLIKTFELDKTTGFLTTDSKRSFLFGPSYQVPTFNFLGFCKSQKLGKIHVIHLDCGGNELSLLKSIPEYLKDGIVVHLKTYHQKIRTGISQFQQIHELMTNQGYELFSHYIYDDVIGDALYVKSKYVSAVFRSKEL
jgi:hypothetical protein